MTFENVVVRLPRRTASVNSRYDFVVNSTQRVPKEKGTSVASIGSVGSIASIGSVGSIASIGSAGSIASIGSAGSIASIGSVGSILSIGSTGSVLSINAVGAWRSLPSQTRAVVIATAMGLATVALLRRLAI